MIYASYISAKLEKILIVKKEKKERKRHQVQSWPVDTTEEQVEVQPPGWMEKEDIRGLEK